MRDDPPLHILPGGAVGFGTSMTEPAGLCAAKRTYRLRAVDLRDQILAHVFRVSLQTLGLSEGNMEDKRGWG